MKTYSRINTMDVEHSRAPKSNDGFVFSDDIGKWMHSGAAKSAKAQRDKYWTDKRNKT